MLYSFDIQYYDEPSQRRMPGTIIIDLPQQYVADVRRNPFVIDLVNCAFMKDGILNLLGHKDRLVDNIDYYGPVLRDTVSDIKCLYRDSATGHKSFYYYIYIKKTANTFFPVSELTFNSTVDYEAYEELYFRGYFISAPQIPLSIVTPQSGYYYLFYNISTVNLLKFVNVSGLTNHMMQVITANGLGNVINTTIGSVQVRHVRLCDELLILMGFTYLTGKLYDIPQCEYYEKRVVLSDNTKRVIQLKKERIGFNLVIADKNEQYGCKLIFVFSLHELQYEIDFNLHFKMIITQMQEVEISQFENKMFFDAKVIEELPIMLEKYKSQNSESTLSDKIKYVASYYRIAEPMASHYLLSIHES